MYPIVIVRLHVCMHVCVCACINLIPLGPLSIIREQSSCMNIKRLLPVVYATELIINEV